MAPPKTIVHIAKFSTKQPNKFKTWKHKWMDFTVECLTFYKKPNDCVGCGLVSCERIKEAEVNGHLHGKWAVKISMQTADPIFIGFDSQDSAVHWANELKHAKTKKELQQWMIDSNKVHLEKVIGSGAYGKVWKGTIAGATVAVKEMLKSCNNEMVEKEIQLLAQIRSPYCVRLLGIYYQADKLFIVTEFIQGGDLSDVIHKKTGGSLSETIKLKILLDVARGVAFLHENNIIHRDLKTDNCLIRSLHPEAPQYAVLADFGISKFVVSLGEATDVSHTRAMGTPVYMAPECFQKNYTTKLDVYSYGILMNEVFSEERPWSHLSDTRWNSEIHDRVDQGQRPRMNFSEVQYAHASEIKNIITCCWAGNPTTRPTMSHVVQMLNHLLEACAIANNKTKFSMTPCVGIAFGSSTCAVSYNHPNGNTELIPNAQGNRKTPCYVAFTDTGVLTGDMAKSQITRNASNTVYDILLLVGRYYSDPVIQQRIPTWPFTVINHTNFPMVQVEHQNQRKNFTPEELMAILLKQLKHDAETYLNITVPLAVISIPSSFSMLQRQCILDAGQIAGLSFERILPASNVVPLTMGTKVGESLRLICDLGASTCEISLIIFDDTVYEVRENCSESVGGDDFDARMMQHFISEFERRFHIPHREICTNKRAIQRLRIACERAKQTLSSSNNAAIELPSWYDGIDFYSRISRQTFQQINYDLFQRVMNPIVAVAEKNKSSIDEIVLIGGSSRVPYVQELIQDYFNGKSLSKRLHPDEAPALGLALQAGIVSGYNIDDLILLVTPRTIGFTDLNGNKTPVVNLNTTIPTLKSQEIPSTIVSAGIVQVYEEDPAIHTPRIVGEADLKSLSLSGTLTIFVAFDERFEIKVSVKSDTQHVVPLTGSKFTPTVLAHMQENLTTL